MQKALHLNNGITRVPVSPTGGCAAALNLASAKSSLKTRPTTMKGSSIRRAWYPCYSEGLDCRPAPIHDPIMPIK